MRISPCARVFQAFLLIILLLGSASSAAVRTWDGGGSTNNWSEAANWSDNTAPQAGDTATFSATSLKHCTIDADATVANFFLSSAYTGTITQKASLTVSSAFTQEGTGKFLCATPESYAFTCESFSISSNVSTFVRFSGSGTGASPYLIYDVYGLQALKQHLNNASVFFKLAQDIDASITRNWNAGAGFQPAPRYFKGYLFGDNKTITGLYVNRPGVDETGGLFGFHYGGSAATVYVKDLALADVDVTGGRMSEVYSDFCMSEAPPTVLFREV